jgi:hypothetical protein
MQSFQLLGHMEILAHSWKKSKFAGIPIFVQSVCVILSSLFMPIFLPGSFSRRVASIPSEFYATFIA